MCVCPTDYGANCNLQFEMRQQSVKLSSVRDYTGCCLTETENQTCAGFFG